MGTKRASGRTFKVLLQPVPGKSPVFFEMPFDPKEAFGDVRAAIVVTIGAYSFRTRVASMFGKTIVGLNRENREGAGVAVGQTVTVAIAADAEERTVTPPEDFVAALQREKGAWAAWGKLSYTHQREDVRAIEDAKKAETRQKRIEKSVSMLAEAPKPSSDAKKNKSAEAGAPIDDYIKAFPPKTRERLEVLRRLIQQTAPEATEKISYGIPTFYLGGNLVHFAGYERHIGFYPGASGIATFQKELSAYKSAKGSVQLPLSEPVPIELIRRIVAHRVGENTSKAGAKAKAPRSAQRAKRA